MAFSNTRLSTFKRCRLRYHWNYTGAALPRVGAGLRRGKAGHAALAAYYGGQTRVDAIAKAWESFEPTAPDTLEAMLHLDEVLDRYLRWSATADGWKVLEVEYPVEVEYGDVKLMGIWDLLVEKNGKRFIVDHKFQKAQQFSHLEVDTQVSHYLALGQLAGANVHGMIYNIVNLDSGPQRRPALRQVVSRSATFLRAYLEGLLPVIAEIELLDRGDLAVYPNWTKDCCWDCGFYRRCVDRPYRKGG